MDFCKSRFLEVPLLAISERSMPYTPGGTGLILQETPISGVHDGETPDAGFRISGSDLRQHSRAPTPVIWGITVIVLTSR